jgi:hypothetical protein
MPPLIISLDNLDAIMTGLERAIDEVIPNLKPGQTDGLE